MITELLKRIEKIKQSQFVNLSAAEISHFKICSYPFDKINGVYLHGSKIQLEESYKRELTREYREIVDLEQPITKRLTNFEYCDYRTSTALQALQMVILALSKPNETVYYNGKQTGGHSSYKEIISNLGRKPIELKFQSNQLPILSDIESESLILLGFSDILHTDINTYIKHFDNLQNENFIVIDTAQISGFIYNNLLDIAKDKKIAILGSTHKTIPLLPKGFILTNNFEIYSLIDKVIFPTFVRTNDTLNQIANILGLLVYENVRHFYLNRIVEVRNRFLNNLSKDLLIHSNQGYFQGESHQLWIEIANSLYYRNLLEQHYIYTDNRILPFGFGEGLRLGIQQIAADGLSNNSIDKLCETISDLCNNKLVRNNFLYEIDKSKSIWFQEEIIIKNLI